MDRSAWAWSRPIPKEGEPGYKEGGPLTGGWVWVGLYVCLWVGVCVCVWERVWVWVWVGVWVERRWVGEGVGEGVGVGGWVGGWSVGGWGEGGWGCVGVWAQVCGEGNGRCLFQVVIGL